MPSVNIREINNTGSSLDVTEDFTVLFPGLINQATWKNKVTVSETTTYLPTKFTNKDDFIAYFGDQVTGKGYKAALSLIEAGLIVVYAPINATSGSSANTENVPVGSGNKCTFYDEFWDRGKWDLRFILTGLDDAAKETENYAVKAAIKCAAERGDAIALITTDSSKSTVSGIQTILNGLTDEEVDRTASDGTAIKESVDKYAAAFAPEIKSSTTTTTSGVIAYLLCFAKQIKTTPEWLATAGSVRGAIPLNEVTPTVAFGDNAINDLQPRRADKERGWSRSCNVISEIRPYGTLIWGNRTLYKPSQIEVTKYGNGLRASHFLNIRQLCCTLKKVLYRAARKYAFEPNSDVLWTNFVAEIKPTLDKMRTGQGIRGYKIIREQTSQKAVLKATIKIVPIEAVEDFDLSIEMADSIEIAE